MRPDQHASDSRFPGRHDLDAVTRTDLHLHIGSSMSHKLLQRWAKHWQGKQLPLATVDYLVKQYKKWLQLPEPAEIHTDQQLQLWMRSVFDKVNQNQLQNEPRLREAYAKLDSASDGLKATQAAFEQAQAADVSQAVLGMAQKAVDNFVGQREAAESKLLVVYRRNAHKYLRTMFQTWADVLRHDGFVWRLSTFHNSLCRPTAEEDASAPANDGAADLCGQNVVTQAASQAGAVAHESSSLALAADPTVGPSKQRAARQPRTEANTASQEAGSSASAGHSTDFDRFEDFMDASGFRRHFLRMAKTQGELRQFLKSVLEEAAATFVQVGVQYVEFSIHPNTLEDWKDVLLDVVCQVEAQYPVTIRFLCAFNRLKYATVDVEALKRAGYAEFLSCIQPPQCQRDMLLKPALEGLDTLKRTIPYLGNLVIGLDVVGAENSGAYIPLVEPEFVAFIAEQQCSNPSFGCRLHAGEAWDDEWKGKGLLSALHAIKILRQRPVKVRIGHGVELAALVQQPEAFGVGLPFQNVQDLYTFLKEHFVVTELCLISNLMLKQSPRKRQTLAFLDLVRAFDLPYTFGSDNSPLFQGAPAVSELLRLFASQDMTSEEARRLIDMPQLEVDQSVIAQAYHMSPTEIVKGHQWGVEAAFSIL